MERNREFMSDKVWDMILYNYILPYRHINAFCPPTFIGHKDSEPLLDKKLPLRLRDIAGTAPDLKIDIYSNAVLLPNWHARGHDFIDFLARLPNKVRMLLSYHPVNHDESVNDYSKVVPYLTDVLRNPPPNIEFISVSHKSKWVTPQMQEDWVNTWRGLPITVHSNCSINPWTGRMEDIATCHYNGCPYADFGHWFMGVTGNIIACCLDLEEEIILGNVLTHDPADMFAKTDAFYKRQREILENKSRVDHQVCANCYGQKRDEPSELLQLGVL